MNTSLLIWLIGGVLAAIILSRWAYNECYGDITLSDLSFIIMAFIAGFGLSWVVVIFYLVDKIMSKYGKKVIIKRRKG